MRTFINICETYGENNSALLRHLNNPSFDPYRYWSVICMWIEDNDYLPKLNATLRSEDREEINADDLSDADPFLFYDIDANGDQYACQQFAIDYMKENEPGAAQSNEFFQPEDALLPRNTWLIHFTDHADSIMASGFTHGTFDMDMLGLTTRYTHDSKKDGGYVFAFEADSRYAWYAARTGRYGKHAILFQNSGVKAYHYGDEEDQIIFWGPDVDKRMLIHLSPDYEGGRGSVDWNVLARDGRVLFTGEITKTIAWVEKNTVQYRRALGII